MAAAHEVEMKALKERQRLNMQETINEYKKQLEDVTTKKAEAQKKGDGFAVDHAVHDNYSREEHALEVKSQVLHCMIQSQEMIMRRGEIRAAVTNYGTKAPALLSFQEDADLVDYPEAQRQKLSGAEELHTPGVGEGMPEK